VRKARDGKKKSDVASLVGESLAKKAKEQGIKSVVFDRGGFKYQGRVKALAEAARKGGLSF
jgi:large subunit ribosomal protein L18